jgi:hypothetical protein
MKDPPNSGCKLQPLACLLHIVKDVVVIFREAFHPSIRPSRYTCKIAHLQSNYELSLVFATYWIYSLSQLGTSIFPTNKLCCLFGVESWNKQDPLRQEAPNYSILEDFMIIIFSSRTRRHHLCHTKQPNHGHPSKDTQRHLTKWNHKKTLSRKTTEPPPSSRLPPYLYCKKT